MTPTAIMKYLVVIVLVANIAFGEESVYESLSVGEKRSLAELSVDQLPETMQKMVRTVTKNTEHWCCKIRPTKVVVNSRAEQRYIKRSQQHTNYGHCGFWGWSRCARHSVTYYSASTYVTVYSKKTVTTTCPDQDVVCCRGFIEVAHNCLPLDSLPAAQKDLLRLKQQGVLFG